jgi:cystathionine beta-synthase
VHQNFLTTIGQTPLIQIHQHPLQSAVYGKFESFNPGHSAKDRIALFMLNELEKSGALKPGGTVVEASSGNTARSLAMICALKGYSCVVFTTSKISTEKKKILTLFGATVHVCPAEAAPDAPDSYYSCAADFAQKTPNAVYLNQYFNEANVNAHYAGTGPEIWEQTNGQITHLVCCAGTGGTISGTAKFLKEQNPEIKVIAVDAKGSLLTKFFNTGKIDRSEVYPYGLEGVGKNIVPGTLHNEYIDTYVQVSDVKALSHIQPLAQTEGLLVGPSGGAILQALHQWPFPVISTDLVVCVFPDHGISYLSKF